MPLQADGPIRCLECDEGASALRIRSWGHYRAAMEPLLYAFKFGRQHFLDAPLATLLNEVDLDIDPTSIVVPVPMHPSKLRARGYNQAELLARRFARSKGLSFRRDLLHKTRDNRTQSQLPKSERAANVRGAFAASERAHGHSILLIDDICTTGETLRACAAALRKAGAARVCALTVARA